MSDPQDVVVCVDSFCYRDDEGYEHSITKGTTVQIGHPILRGREQFFGPLQVDHQVVRRGPGRPRKE